MLPLHAVLAIQKCSMLRIRKKSPSLLTKPSGRLLQATDCFIVCLEHDHDDMQCIQAMPAGVGQWVWVSDFKGFGLSDCDPRLAKVFLDLSAAHYPERLGLFLVIDAPWSVPFHFLLHARYMGT